MKVQRATIARNWVNLALPIVLQKCAAWKSIWSSGSLENGNHCVLSFSKRILFCEFWWDSFLEKHSWALDLFNIFCGNGSNWWSISLYIYIVHLIDGFCMSRFFWYSFFWCQIFGILFLSSIKTEFNRKFDLYWFTLVLMLNDFKYSAVQRRNVL